MAANRLIVSRILQVCEPSARSLGLDRLEEDRLILAPTRSGGCQMFLDCSDFANRFSRQHILIYAKVYWWCPTLNRTAATPILVPGGRNSQLKSSGLAKVRFKRTLPLVDMVTSGGLTRLGAESSLTSGSGYKNSQRWSQALRKHPSKPDGVYCRSRHDPARTASALFDHCEGLVEVAEMLGAWSDQSTLLAEILDHYALGTDL